MFKITGPVLSSQELKTVQMATARKIPFPEFNPKFGLSNSQWQKLKKLWEDFKGTVKYPNNFALATEFDEGLYGVVRLKQGKIKVSLEDDESIERFSNDLWPIVHAPPVIKAARTVRPNQPCPCGSGRKAKKCCGT